MENDNQIDESGISQSQVYIVKNTFTNKDDFWIEFNSKNHSSEKDNTNNQVYISHGEAIYGNGAKIKGTWKQFFAQFNSGPAKSDNEVTNSTAL